MRVIALLVVISAVGFTYVTNTQGGESTYARNMELCAGAEDHALVACIEAAAREKNLSNEHMARITRETFANMDTARCHQALHSLGRVLSTRLRNGPELPREAWESCGYGLLHGAYENLEKSAFDDEAPIDTCNRVEFTGTEGIDLRDNCVHAVGHSAWKVHDMDIGRALAACTRSRERADALSCSSGVYMSYYDSTIPADRMTSASGVAALLRGCASHPHDLAAICASFYEISVRSGTIPEHLEVCLNVSFGDSLCHYKLGLHGALGVLSGNARAEDVSNACNGEGARALERCWSGAYDGSASHGLGTTEREQLACSLFPWKERCNT